jgi:tRNA pseudouridine38-40 synthase
VKNFKITIEYDGTHFSGWQVQGQNTRTVQGEIERALETITQKRVRVFGSGRTDSGVHAKGQVAHFKSQTKMGLQEFLCALNGNLPDDVRITKIEEASPKFHAQFHVKTKTYRYTILNRAVSPVMERNFCLHVPYKLNIARMREAARLLEGRHDFRSFMTGDPGQRKAPPEKDTVRNLFSLKITRKKHFIFIDAQSNGFLYKMVRSIIGTLLFVGSGKLTPQEVAVILKSKNRTMAGDTAPAHGLCLMEVVY